LLEKANGTTLIHKEANQIASEDFVITKRLLSCAFWLFLLVTAVCGQTVKDSHEQAVLDFLNALKMENILRNISTALVENLIKANPPLASQRDLLVEWSQKYVTWEAAVPELTKAFKETFTESELREIIGFYRTPTGQKMATKLPELMTIAAKVSGSLAGSHIPDLQRMLQERLKKPENSPAPGAVPNPQ
jgi:uncharacterized protein